MVVRAMNEVNGKYHFSGSDISHNCLQVCHACYATILVKMEKWL